MASGYVDTDFFVGICLWLMKILHFLKDVSIRLTCIGEVMA